MLVEKTEKSAKPAPKTSSRYQALPRANNTKGNNMKLSPERIEDLLAGIPKLNHYKISALQWLKPEYQFMTSLPLGIGRDSCKWLERYRLALIKYEPFKPTKIRLTVLGEEMKKKLSECKIPKKGEGDAE